MRRGATSRIALAVVAVLVAVVGAAIGSVALAGPARPVAVAEAPPPSSEPSPSPTDATSALLAQISARGAHCVECYLLWSTHSGEQLLEPPAPPAPPVRAGWLRIDLEGADGRSLRLADFAGHPMLIELMATWCASCAAQQDTLRESRASLPADTVIVSLDVDPTSSPGSLGSYAAARGYDWVFAPSPIELSRALRSQFGDAVLNPAATPIVVVDRAGVASLAPLGHKDAEALMRLAGG